MRFFRWVGKIFLSIVGILVLGAILGIVFATFFYENLESIAKFFQNFI